MLTDHDVDDWTINPSDLSLTPAWIQTHMIGWILDISLLTTILKFSALKRVYNFMIKSWD